MSTGPKKLFMFGNPLLDIAAKVDMALLEEFGLKPANAIIADESHVPLYAKLAAMPDAEYIPGGSTLNTARVAKWMLQEGSVAYTGCIGKDKFGETLVKNAEEAGVTMLPMVDPETPTGTCGVLITGTERSLCAYLAAANKFKEEHMATKDVADAIAAADIMYSAGFFLTVAPEAAVTIASSCSANKKVFACNLSAPFIPQFFKDQLAKELHHADIVFGNEDEAEAFGKAAELDFASDRMAVAKHIAELPKSNDRPRVVVITQGSEPTIIATAGQSAVTVPVPAVPKDQIEDTNGAGDAFVGGFLAALAKGYAPTQCAEAGHWSAGHIIRRSSCTYEPKPIGWTWPAAEAAE